MKVSEGKPAAQDAEPGVSPPLEQGPAAAAATAAASIVRAAARSEEPSITYVASQESAPITQERWRNHGEEHVRVRATPEFIVRPGGVFDFDARFHNAIHDMAPQLSCSRWGCEKAEDQSLHALMHRTQEAS